MKRNTIYIFLSLMAFLFSCSNSNTNEQEDFEDITEFILCTEIQFTEDLNSCFTVNITSSLGSESYENCLDDSSNICLNIPAQELITFEIGYTDNCGNVQTYTEIHGPFIFDPSLDDVLITVDNIETYANYNISGTVNDCNNNSTTNGAVILNLNGKQLIQIINDGAFEFNDIDCSTEDTYSIFAIDFNTNQISETLTFPSTDTDIELGLINTCSALEEMITYQISDHPVITYQNVDFQTEDNSFYKEVTYNSSSSDSFFSLIWYEGFQFGLSDANGDISDASYDPDISLIEHSIGQVGEFMIISFSGYITYYDDSVMSKQINGIICVLRDF